MNPRIYLESSFISYLTARQSTDSVKLVRQQLSRDFWDLRDQKYSVFISDLVVEEIKRGDLQAAEQRLLVCRDLERLPITESAQNLASALIATGAVPKAEPEDALHIALAATAQMDFIATWNFSHLVGPVPKLKLQRILAALGFEKLVLATPEELVQGFL
jgi:predicted nucleic acid-binding protein